MIVKVVPYNPIWESIYEIEEQQIKYILNEILVDLYHIGSTSVKGLKAKPIIDIMLVVKDITQVDAYNQYFELLGYECMGEFGIPGRRYFRKGGDNRTHQIHVFEETNQNDILRHLAVRDFLRAHPAAADEYGALKEKLACEFPDDIEAYCDGKDAFVQDLEQRALAWYQPVK